MENLTIPLENYSCYVIEYDDGSKPDYVENYWFKLLIKFRKIKRITKRTYLGDIYIEEIIREQ